MVESDRPQMTIWRMRFACWITKATDTHSDYVIFIRFPSQQQFPEHAPMLGYTALTVLFCQAYYSCHVSEHRGLIGCSMTAPPLCYDGLLISPQPDLLSDVFCLMVRIFRLMLVLFYIYIYRGADKSLARPTSRCILFDGENISFDASLVIYIYIYIYIYRGADKSLARPTSRCIFLMVRIFRLMLVLLYI